MVMPVCFMIMPFGSKKTSAEPPYPSEIDFDALWRNALSPAIVELGYEPVRADQDLSALIITEMIERLALSDLVIADMTIPNGNVYYEVGVRHAAAREGCVMVSASWAKPLFDVAQMRQVRYPLPEGSITDETAAEIRKAIVAGASKLKSGMSPVYESLPGYPSGHTVTNAKSFKTFLEQLSAFRSAEAAVVAAPKSDRAAKALALRDEYAAKPGLVPFVALEVLRQLRDYTDWKTTLAFIEQLPDRMQELAVVKEQRALARAKTGDPAAAVGILEELIAALGDTSERQGLLGGRYKQLHDAALKKQEESGPSSEVPRYLDKAIEHYQRGMQLDLNDYYPSSNLPRLYRLRGDDGDAERATAVATVALTACERARARDPKDPWVRTTQLGVNFDMGRVSECRKYLKELQREGVAAWQLATTLKDLQSSIETRPKDDPARPGLQEIIEALRKMLPKES